MKAILALSSALLLLFGMQGSAGTLRCGFDDGDQGWVSSGSLLSWERYGGDPGGFLQAEGQGGISSIRSPPSWSGDWSGYVGGVIIFHERLMAADGTHPGEGFVTITSSDGTAISTRTPGAERSWTVREVVLNATNFGVQETEFRRMMRSVSWMALGTKSSGKRLILAVDEVSVAPPSGLDLATAFDDGDGGWRPEGDVSLSWMERGGNGGGFLQGRDLGDGSTWYFSSPRSWSGDWTPYLGGALSFDLKMIDSGKGGPHGGDEVVIVATDGSSVSISPSSPYYSEEIPGSTWTRRHIPLTPEAFETTEELFGRVIRSVDRILIRGEHSDRSDVEGIDNVVVSPPVKSDLVSTFDGGDEGWRGGRDVSLSWRAEGGNPGGFIEGVDQGAGQTWYYVSPASWAGDWTPYIGGTLGFDIVEIDSGNGSPTFGDVVRIYGRDGSYLSWSSDPPASSWTRRQVSLVPSSFKVSGGTFDSVMKGVSEVWIRGEYSNMRDVGGLDNVVVTQGPGG
ncbi:MAG: Laminin IV type A domain-containing protein [Methanothrix sp.]|jgi:hypothetical protein|nr:MAG: Laminin IV type A domain-containing protein [Methanothrix sp.]